MKIIEYPETRQVFYFDCGADALVSLLVFAGIEEREDRIMLLAGTTKSGTTPRASCVCCGITVCRFTPVSGCESTIFGGPSMQAILRC